MPMFKKSGGKIFAVQFNKAEEKALNQAINEQIVANDRAFDMDKESSILWMLHTQFGFGPKRLKLAWKLFYAVFLCGNVLQSPTVNRIVHYSGLYGLM